MESHEAMRAASDFLARGGFVAQAEQAFQLGSEGWTTLEMRRGRKNASRAKDPTECPQLIRLEWDRGRVTVAAAIEPQNTRGRGFLWGGFLGLAISAGSRASRRTREHSDLMITLSRGIETLLSQRRAPEEAALAWFAMEGELKAKARRSRVRSWIYLGIFLAVVVALIVLMVIVSSRR